MLKYLKKIIVGKKKESSTRNFVWNMIGSAVYSLASMILIIGVVQIVGNKKGGVFVIALTISQMLMFIAYFELRTFQVTDTKNEFEFKDYYTTKIFTCASMIIISVFYVVFKGYENEKAAVILLMCIYKMIDGLSDVFEGTFQKVGRLDLAGKSLTFRTIISSSVLLITLAVSKNIILSLIMTIVVAVMGLIVFNYLIVVDYTKLELTKDLKKTNRILISCFPLFMGVFLWSYILSASRIAIDANMPSQYLTYYAALFMPVSIINLFVGFVLRPMLTTLSELYEKNETRMFKNIIKKNIVLLFVFTLISMIGAYVAGIPVLSFLYKCDLTNYRMVLVFLMLAGGLNALGVLGYYILTIMRRQKSIIIGYVTASLLAMIISSPFVKKMGILGAACSYFLVVLLLCLVFTALLFRKKIGKD